MSQNNSSVVSYGIGFPGLLFITFLVLKLTHVIDWAWWIIFAPLWGEAAIVIILLIVLCIIAVATGVKKIWD